WVGVLLICLELETLGAEDDVDSRVIALDNLTYPHHAAIEKAELRLEFDAKWERRIELKFLEKVRTCLLLSPFTILLDAFDANAIPFNKEEFPFWCCWEAIPILPIPQNLLHRPSWTLALRTQSTKPKAILTRSFR
ncbi:hypothetical protein AMTR_s00045p00017640, partial [Amborella trichopoda]